MAYEVKRFSGVVGLVASCLLLLAGCGDAGSEQKEPEKKSPPPVIAWLSKEVGPHKEEMGLAGEIFTNQAERKTKALAAAWDAEKGAFDTGRLFALLEKESLHLQDLKADELARYVTVAEHKDSAGNVKWLTIRLKGSDSSRRLFLVNGGAARQAALGCASSSTEIAAALEVMRVFISRRATARKPTLPFDLEYVFCTNAQKDMGFVSALADKSTVLGVICIGEMTPKKPGASNLVVRVVPGEKSTVAHALTGSVLHFAGSRPAWKLGSVSADLDAVPASSRSQINQRFLPYVVVQAASSQKDRTIKAGGFKPTRTSQKEIDAVHAAVGTANDKIEVISDQRFTTTVAVARAIAIGVTRCSAAFAD